MYILYRLMHKRTEEHSVRTYWHKFQFSIKFVLQGTGFINRDM